MKSGLLGNPWTDFFGNLIKMLVLGIDPGSRVAGYGIVEEKNGKLSAVAFDTIKPPVTPDLSPRLAYIFNTVTEIIKKHKPDEIAVESVFFAKNARSALILGQARSAAILPGLLAGIPLYEYTALQLKKAVVGNGHAQKSQVADMVCRILGIKKIPKPADVTDALAVAVCHVHSAPMAKRLKGIGVR